MGFLQPNGQIHSPQEKNKLKNKGTVKIDQQWKIVSFRLKINLGHKNPTFLQTKQKNDKTIGNILKFNYVLQQYQLENVTDLKLP